MRAFRGRVVPAVLAAAFSAAPLDAQDNWEIGLRSGVTFGGMGGGSGVESRRGTSFGATVTHFMTPWIALQAELLYTSQGMRYAADRLYNSVPNTSIGGAPPSQNTSARFLQIPVLGRFNFGKLMAGPVRPTFYAGPQASYMITCQMTGTGYFSPVAGTSSSRAPCDQFSNRFTPTTSPFTDLRTFDVGAVAGLGLEIDLFNKIQIAGDLRYHRGFGRMNALEQRFYNQSWSVMFFLSPIGSWGANGSQGAFIDAPMNPMREGAPKQKGSMGSKPVRDVRM
jgi:hypothetical protein